MRFPWALLIGLIFVTPVLVYITVSVKVVTSFDPEFVTFSGTHYIATFTATPPAGSLLPYGTIDQVEDIQTITQILGWGTYGGSCNQWTYITPTIAGWDNVPVGQVISFNLPAGRVYLYRHDVNTLSYYCIIQTATGAKYHYNALFKNHTKIGDYTIFRMAKRGEVTTGQMCTAPSGLPHTIVYAILRGERYDCTTGSYTGYGTPNTQSVNAQVGAKLGSYYTVTFSGYTVVLHGMFYPNQAGTLVIRPE